MCLQGLEVLGQHSPSQHLHSYSMLARIAVGRGELDKAGRYIEQVHHLIKQSQYHVDWTANASLSLLLYWQARGDKTAIEHWLTTTHRPEKAYNHFSNCNGAILLAHKFASNSIRKRNKP
ncbi:hypothetical protein ACT691_05640 [Vibrio metschnikovii]